MSSQRSIDALDAVDLLVEEISGTNNMPAEISRLIRAIDTIVYSMHTIDPNVPYIEETDLAVPRSDYRNAYELIKHRYPTLGLYWQALNPIMKDGTEGQVAVGDAIDDLADILIELYEVQWLNKHADRRNALAAMKARYDIHLRMHFHPLRQYLEEMTR